MTVELYPSTYDNRDVPRDETDKPRGSSLTLLTIFPPVLSLILSTWISSFSST